jgi:kumamolisin
MLRYHGGRSWRVLRRRGRETFARSVRPVSLQRIDGTFRDAWPGTSPGVPFDPDERARVTVWFGRAGGARSDARDVERTGALPVGERTYETRRGFAVRTRIDDRVLAEFERYCTQRRLTVEAHHWRSVVIAGRLEDLVAAFGANVDIRTSSHGDPFRHRHGWLHLPQHLATHVSGVFGLHAWCRTARVDHPTRDRVPLEPRAVARRYTFPLATGAGQTIGIIAYEATYRTSDYALAMRRLGVERADPILKRVDGERAARHADRGADLEAATDVQIACALAPGARVVVYEAPHDERGCLDAIRTAIFDDDYAPAAISLSYGIVERQWTRAARALLDDLFVAAATIGISVFVASGDNGAELDDDGRPHVNAPAASPYVLACGATKIERDEHGRLCEVAWHRSGGGFGRARVPSWQTGAAAWAERHGIESGRGVPDVSAQCDPGYPVYFEGRELSMHGTSAVAPLWAALAARIDENATRAFGPTQTIGFFAPLLYANAAAIMLPIARGGNETFRARARWNPCVGLGTPNGLALERALLGR